MAQSEFETVKVLIQGISNDAILCLFDEETDDEQEQWVPRSQIEDGGDEVEIGDDAELNIKRWWLDKNDISY